MEQNEARQKLIAACGNYTGYVEAAGIAFDVAINAGASPDRAVALSAIALQQKAEALLKTLRANYAYSDRHNPSEAHHIAQLEAVCNQLHQLAAPKLPDAISAALTGFRPGGAE